MLQEGGPSQDFVLSLERFSARGTRSPQGRMEQFDRDAPLFDRRLHVLVQYPDRDEKLTPLTIRLLHGVRVRTAFLALKRESY